MNVLVVESARRMAARLRSPGAAAFSLAGLAAVSLAGAAAPLMGQTPRLELSADTVLVDQPFSFRAVGLQPGERATIRLSLESNAGVWERGVWRSHATYMADADGRIVPAEASPVDGMYEGADAMGLLWSALPDTTAERSAGLAPGLERVALTLETETGEVADAVLWRRTSAPGVQVVDVADSVLVGSLFLPPSGEPHPGVLVLGGSECGNESSKRTGALLASHGFAALALAYCVWPDQSGNAPAGREHLARGVMEVSLEYAERGLGWLRDRPEVAPDRVGIWGASKGAELALIMATADPSVPAIVAIVPSHVVWYGLARPWRTGSSWTRSGQPIPFVPFFPDSAVVRRIANGAKPTLAHLYEASLADTGAVRRASIPVERMDGALLLVSGKDDTLWPSYLMAGEVERRLRETGSGIPYFHLANENAGHALGPPFYPTTAAAERVGGTPAGTAAGQQATWARTLEFLDEHLAQTGP